jgi:hypothetical protein
MRLYDGMIGLATRGFDKARFAALLKALAAPADDGPRLP